VLVVGARSIESLYMIPALWRLADCPNATIIPVTDIPQAATPAIRSGTPIDHLPALYPYDIVYAAGAPNLVEAVKEVAQASGALWYADPFVSNTEESQDGLFTRAVSWLKGEAGPASPPAASTQRDLGSETRRPRPTGQRSPARMI